MSDQNSEETKAPEVPETLKKKRLSKGRKRIELELEDEDGAIRDYVLIEMSGSIRDQWLGEQAAKVKYDPKTGQPIGIKDFKGSQADLIAKCLRSMPGEKPVGVDEIQKWSSSLQASLAEMCAELNGLTKEAAEAAKKD